MSSFCDRLSELQAQKGCLKKDVANAVGLSLMGYYRYERGGREPQMSILIALADYFNVSIDYLVGRTDCPIVIKNEHIMMLSPEEQQRILKDRKKADS